MSMHPAGSGLFEEEYFLRFLELERKRSRRTRRPMLLLLIDLGDLRSFPNNWECMLDRNFARHFRDTDIRGWYEQGVILGIIFSEISHVTPKTKAVLSRKLAESLQFLIRPMDLNKIHMTFVHDSNKERTGILREELHQKTMPTGIQRKSPVRRLIEGSLRQFGLF